MLSELSVNRSCTFASDTEADTASDSRLAYQLADTRSNDRDLKLVRTLNGTEVSLAY